MIYERSAKIGTASIPASIAETNPNLVSTSGDYEWLTENCQVLPSSLKLSKIAALVIGWVTA